MKTTYLFLRRAALWTACLLVVLLTGRLVQAAEVLPADVEEASDGCILLGIEGSYLVDTQAAIDRINEIRLEACQEGVQDPRNSSRNLTLSDYVPIKWSSELEQIARIRAAENSISYYIVGHDHYRLNQKNIYTVTSNGVRGWAEDIAYHSTSENLVYGINQWYGEKADWVNQTPDAVTGHYTSIINPNYKYIGLGYFNNDQADYPRTLAGQLSFEDALDESRGTAAENITQTLDVSLDYITDWKIIGNNQMQTGQEETLSPQAILTNDSFRFTMSVAEPLTFTSSDPSVLSISGNTVRAAGEGTAVITAYRNGTELSSQTITVDSCEHHFVLESTDPSTCAAPGTAHYKCTICGKTKEEALPLGAHTFTYTDNADGTVTGVCSVCGFTFTAAQPGSLQIYWSLNNTLTGYSSAVPSSVSLTDILYAMDFGDVVGGVSFESSDEAVFSFERPISGYSSPLYELKPHAPGIVTLKVYSNYFPSLSKTCTLRVGGDGSVDIAAADVTLSPESYDYNGSARQPVPTVSYSGNTLKKGTDYTVAYENNINAGTAEVILTGTGFFTGTKTVEFAINPLSLADAAVTLGNTSYECDGTAKEPSVTVKKGSKTLTAGTDYTVSYENNTLPGTAAAVITGTGNYTGTLRKEFTITHKNHTYGDWETEVPATCTETGEQRQYCLYCSEYNSKGIPATGHTFGEWIVESEATCTENGEQRRYCTKCDAFETQVIQAAGHPGYTEWISNEDGTHSRNCIKGDDPQTENCSYTYEVITPATYDEAGEGKYTCTVCGYSYTEDIPVNECSHETTHVDGQKEASCTEAGYTGDVVCDICLHTIKTGTVIPAKGHVPVTDAAVEATCVQTGLTEGSHCSECSEVLTPQQEIPVDKNNHKNVTVEGQLAPSCTVDGYTGNRVCQDCGVTVEYGETIPAAHEWETEYRVDIPATCIAPGRETIHCRICGESKPGSVRPIDKIPHSLTWIEEAENSCEEDGHIGYYYCDSCEMMYADQDGQTELTAEEVLLPAKGHTLVFVPEQPPACEVYGTEEYWFCTACGKYFEDGAGTVPLAGLVTIPALDHDWDEGTVIETPTGAKPGTVLFTCRRDSSHIYKTTIPPLRVETLKLNKTSAELAVGQTLQLEAQITPADASDAPLTWTSSDKSIVTVDKNGKVTAKKYGKATVTVTERNGLSASCEIQTRFSDVNNPKKTYYTPVYWAVDNGITKCSTAFKPDDTVTRGEFVAFIWRMAGQPKSTAKLSFTDVNSKTKFYDAIRWAVGEGIIKGYKDKTFKSENGVTRGEAATMLWRWAGKPEPKAKKSPFSDIQPSVADSYKAVLWGNENGIIKGSGGKFMKNDGCSRANIVTFLYRYNRLAG